MDYKGFHELVKRDFFPLLRADGFKGNGTTFRRIKGDRIDVVNIQGCKYGGRCCVNIAVHFPFLPIAGGTQFINLTKLKEYDCTFRERLHEAAESDHWWTYGASDEEAEASIASLIDTYSRRSGLYFGRFEPFPGVFLKITPAQLEASDLSGFFGFLTKVGAAATMARTMKHLGLVEECRDFAKLGLRHLRPGVGLRLKAELERLRDGVILET
jgi:hypothetical protein